MEIVNIFNNTPILNSMLRTAVWKAFKACYGEGPIIYFGDELSYRYHLYHLYVDYERFDCYNYYVFKLKDTFQGRSSSYTILPEQGIDANEIAECIKTMLWNIRSCINCKFEDVANYVKYDEEAVNQAVEVYNNKKTIAECAESIINKCGGDEKYSISLALRISLVPYCEDREYIDPLIAKFTNVPRNIQMIDKLEMALHKRGWYAEIHYDKHPLNGLKRIVVNKFYIKVYDNLLNIKHKITQDVTCDVSDSIDLLLRKCYEYLNKDMEAAKNKRAIEDINNIYGYKKEENNMAYFNYNNFDHIDPPQAVKDQSRHRMIQSMEIILGIRDVKFNDPATIVFWDDGTKTVVKCQKGDKFDPEKGLAMAIVKKQVGHNNGYFNEIFKKWCPEAEESKEDVDIPKRPTVFAETAEEYKEEVKKQKKIGDGYDDIRWEKNARRVRK